MWALETPVVAPVVVASGVAAVRSVMGSGLGPEPELGLEYGPELELEHGPEPEPGRALLEAAA